MKGTTIDVNVECCISYKVDELWPDGDAPDPITAEAVAALIEDNHGKWFCDDMRTHGDVSVIVWVANPAYTQDEALLPELRPDPGVMTRARIAVPR